MRYRTTHHIGRLCIASLLFAGAAAHASPPAVSVTTDRGTYEIDDVVGINGASFLDGEPVRLQITLSDPAADGPAPWIVSASGGKITSSWTVDVIRPASVTATLLAEGLVSGRSATTDFVILPPSMDFANVDFVGAEPSSYPHTGTDGGAYDDDTTNADTRESMNGGEFACGDIVTFFLKLQADDDDNFVDNQTVQAMFEFDSDTQSGSFAVGFVAIENVSVNYGTIVDLIVGENTFDDAIDDDRQTGGVDSVAGGSATTDVLTLDPPAGVPHVDLEKLLLTVTIDDIDRAECIVLRIDVRLSCDPGAGIPNSIIKARLTDTRVIDINGTPVDDAIPGGGNMEIPINMIGDITPLQACCFPDDSCMDLAPDACTAAGGVPQGVGTVCASTNCALPPPPGACCFADGSCQVLLAADCAAAGGVFQGAGTVCQPNPCPQPCCLPNGSCVLTLTCAAQGGVVQAQACADIDCLVPCCFDDGSCQERSPDDCTAQGGVASGNLNQNCDSVDCPQPCCLPDGSCVLTLTCAAQGGVEQAQACADIDCLVPCCFDDGSCQERSPDDCAAQGGVASGNLNQNCDSVDCPQIAACCFDDGSCQDLLELDCLAAGGNLLAPGTNCLFFGNPCPQPPAAGERAHPGWNHFDNIITLTANQPICWSVSDGQPAGVAPFGALDPGDPPGRPDPDGSGDRVLRGYVVAIAVDQNGNEIRWNHLAGNTTIVNYADDYAAEHNAYAHAVVADVPNGAAPDGVPGQLNLDGVEYAPAFDALRLNFIASDSDVFSGGGVQVVTDTDITLAPVSLDARQETDGPVTTKASYLVWSENEVEFSGMHRCITCWDERMASLYGAPNHLLMANLQTDCGFARIDGLQSQFCDVDFDPHDDIPFGEHPLDVVSEPAALVGIATRLLDFDAVAGGAVAHTLPGVGTQTAVIRFDPAGESQEAQDGDARWPASPAAMLDWLEAQTGIEGLGNVARTADEMPQAAAAAIGPSAVDRTSATEKGSVLIFPKIELRWSGAAPHDLIQETFIFLTNDTTDDVKVLLYFVNGDPPIPAAP